MISILLNLALLAGISLACSPARLPDCAPEEMLALKEEPFLRLTTEIKAFQAALSEGIKEADKGKTNPWLGRNSCFNEAFASMFADNLIASSKEASGKTCTAQLKQVIRSVEGSLKKDRKEWKAVHSAHLKNVELAAARLEEALANFKKAQSL